MPEINEGLLRQRRNLMIVCCLLCLLAFGDVNIDSLNAAGVSVKFAKPDAILIGLWAAFAYFFVRYFQYFATHAQVPLVSLYERTTKSAVQNLAFSSLRKLYGPNASFAREVPGFFHVFWKGELVFAHAQPGQTDEVTITLTKFQVLRATCAAWFRAVIADTSVSDYLLPFFFAFLTLAYASSADWKGSFGALACACDLGSIPR